MALVKEDGTAVAGANSYVTVAEADTYHSNLGRTDWAAASAQNREYALLKACIQMEARYRTQWSGSKAQAKTGVAQRLSWPRVGVTDEDGIEIGSAVVPPQVCDAQCEIAYLILRGSEFVKAEITSTEARVASETVGPISTSYRTDGQLASTFPLIDQILAPFGVTSSPKVSVVIGLTDDEVERMAERTTLDEWLGLP